MTLIMIAFTVLLENVLHLLGRYLKKHGKHHVIILGNKVLTELMLLGWIGLGLTFIGNFIGGHTIIDVFNWTQMLLFLMAVFFVLNITMIFAVSSALGWRKFERLEDEVNVRLRWAQKARLTEQWLDPEGFVFVHFLLQWREDVIKVDRKYSEVRFWRYLVHGQRKYLAQMTELRWTSWLTVALLALLFAMRYFEIQGSIYPSTLVCMLTMAFFVLAAFLIMYFKFHLGLRQVARHLQADPAAPLEDLYGNLFLSLPCFPTHRSGKASHWGKRFTLHLLQACMLGNVYLLAILVLLIPEFKQFYSFSLHPWMALGLVVCLFCPCTVLVLTIKVLSLLTLVLCTGPHLKQKLLEKVWFQEVLHGEAGGGKLGVSLLKFELHEIETMSVPEMKALIRALRRHHAMSSDQNLIY
eukprot:TRINITY_DN8902_c0_g1_i1.p1 TRINITY_DN8902_c0_g1~~TRINITY_DN8902_c0_g1_i1.p1  ORF type:complete len:455 (-),score=38.86 TRINITY_DN8902_c0_g1_i1:54-1286(-)